MSLTYKIHRSLPDAERVALFEWGTDVFQGALYQLRWRAAERHVVGYLDGKPVTQVGLVKQEVVAGKEKRWVAGVGGVVTVPSQLRKGFARACLLRAHDVMKDELGVSHGFLFCPERLLGFYSGTGWRRIEDKVMIDQPQGKVTSPLLSMVISFGDAWPRGTVDLQSLPW